jgi:hypothetical protein
MEQAQLWSAMIYRPRLKRWAGVVGDEGEERMGASKKVLGGPTVSQAIVIIR